jgi:hypothetical protein
LQYGEEEGKSKLYVDGKMYTRSQIYRVQQAAAIWYME